MKLSSEKCEKRNPSSQCFIVVYSFHNIGEPSLRVVPKHYLNGKYPLDVGNSKQLSDVTCQSTTKKGKSTARTLRGANMILLSWCLSLLSSIIIGYGSTWALFLPSVPLATWSFATAARLRDQCCGQLLPPNHHGTRRRGTMLLLTTGPITTPATNATATSTTAEATADDCNKTFRPWNVMFEKLKAYKEVHGNCVVPRAFVCDDGAKLGLWVDTQRRMSRIIKDAALRELRQRELDAIGFVWVVNERNRQLTPVAGHASKEERFNARWNAMFDNLKEYKAEHGDCLVPKSYDCTDGTKLGHWVANHRSKAATDSNKPAAPTGSGLDWFCLAGASARPKPKVGGQVE
jgi:hypothetical protein